MLTRGITVFAAATALLLSGLGTGSTAHAKEPKVLKKLKVLYDGPHPTPGGGWCNQQGLHFHDYGPVPSRGHYKVKHVKAYKFKGKVYWVCGKHPLDKKTLYEKDDRHLLLKRPYKFPLYQFDKEKECYKFREPLHWICGKHPIKGRKMYKKSNRHYVIGDPPGWPESYKKDSAKNCYTWQKPELKVKQPPQLQVAPTKKDKKKEEGKKKNLKEKKGKKQLKEAGKKGKRLREAH